MKKLLFICSFLFIVILTWVIGVNYSRIHFTKLYKSAEASLRFGDIHRLRKIKSGLEKNCDSQSFDRLNHAIDIKMMLLAEYVQATDDQELKIYITTRDKELWSQLKSYEVNWNKRVRLEKNKKKINGSDSDESPRISIKK